MEVSFGNGESQREPVSLENELPTITVTMLSQSSGSPAHINNIPNSRKKWGTNV